MSEFVLVLAFYAGTAFSAASGVSVSALPVTFATEAECTLAGNKVRQAFENKAKWAGFVCVQHTVPAKG